MTKMLFLGKAGVDDLIADDAQIVGEQHAIAHKLAELLEHISVQSREKLLHLRPRVVVFHLAVTVGREILVLLFLHTWCC